MHYFRVRCHALIACFFLCSLCSNTALEKSKANGIITPRLDDTVSIRHACDLISAHLSSLYGINDTSSLIAFNRAIDRAATTIKKTMIDSLENSSRLMESILALVYRDWRIGFDARDAIVETLLPHMVFHRGKGACLGVSLIILVLAEKLDCPIFGVMLPGHFFCRFDDGVRRINIEPNKEGCFHSDEYYRNRYPVDNRSWYNLDNLSKKEIIGVLCYNAGALCLKQKHYTAALAYFKESARRIPGFVEAEGNLAVAYAQSNNFDSALILFEKLFTAHPDFINLAANYGTVSMASGQYEKARNIYRKGLAYYPRDTALLKGIERTNSLLRDQE